MDDLTSMCLTWRHDFGLLSATQQEAIRSQLRQLHDHHVAPLRQQLDHRTMEGRCIALPLQTKTSARVCTYQATIQRDEAWRHQ